MMRMHYQTEFFLDRPAVQEMIRQLGMDGPALQRAGALIRRTARDSIRTRKKATTYSRPGGVPYSKDPRARFRNIEFRWDPQRQAMVIGHVSYQSPDNQYTPDIHEFGRTRAVSVLLRPDQQTGDGLSTTGRQRRAAAFRKLMQSYGPFAEPRRVRMLRKSQKRGFITVAYPKRPTMGPALEKARSRLPQMWERSLDRSTGGVTALARSGALQGAIR